MRSQAGSSVLQCEAGHVFASPVLLIHGGLGDEMNAGAFWEQPGIAPGLRAAGFTVIAPDRDTTPESWAEAAAAMATSITTSSMVVGGSNGVSVAVRLALDSPPLVDRLVLLWPATAGDQRIDALAPPGTRHLLAGETLRGVTDAELASLAARTIVIASDPPNRAHASSTVEQLCGLIPRVVRHPVGFPEPPCPEFRDRSREFVDALIPLLR